MTDLSWMLAPIVVCLLAVGALGWFGLHVLQRGVIFVDLALAQIAALGATYAVFLGHDPDEPVALALSLLFTTFGAVAFAAIRQFEERVPQEAIIGITYAVSAALGVLMIELAADPHGAEKIQHLLVGNIVWVQWSEIGTAAAAIGLVGLIHAMFGRRFLAISLDADAEVERGVAVAAWDLVFYLSFGLVLTAIVSIIGVLLVFSFLVIPAVVGRLFAGSIGRRLAIGYTVATLASIVGVAISYEHSTGPIIVGLLGAVLAAALAVVSIRSASRPAARVVQLVSVAGAMAAILWSFSLIPVEHEHEHADSEQGETTARRAPADAVLDPLDRLSEAATLARAGDPAGLTELAALTKAEAPFIRMEAHDRLSVVAGDSAPSYDPLEGPDTAGAWSAWAASPPEGWADRAAALAPSP